VLLKVCWKDRVTNKSVREKAERHCTTMDLIGLKQKKLKLDTHAEWKISDW